MESNEVGRVFTEDERHVCFPAASTATRTTTTLLPEQHLGQRCHVSRICHHYHNEHEKHRHLFCDVIEYHVTRNRHEKKKTNPAHTVRQLFFFRSKFVVVAVSALCLVIAILLSSSKQVRSTHYFPLLVYSSYYHGNNRFSLSSTTSDNPTWATPTAADRLDTQNSSTENGVCQGRIWRTIAVPFVLSLLFFFFTLYDRVPQQGNYEYPDDFSYRDSLDVRPISSFNAHA